MLVTHKENDFEQECKTLARCFPTIPDVAWVVRLSIPLLKSVVKLENLIEQLQKYFIFKVKLKPWPACELPLFIVTCASVVSNTDHNLVLLER